MKNNLALILFSGGFDSTYLAIDYLKKGYDVELFYIEIENNQDKVKLESSSVEKITEELRKMFPFSVIQLHNKIISYNVMNYFDNLKTSAQPLFWLSSIPFITREKYDYLNVELAIGYIMKDESISYLTEQRALMDSLKPFMKNSNINLVYPLIKHLKQEIVNFIADMPSIYRFINTCESPATRYIGDDTYLIPCCGTRMCNSCSNVEDFLPKENHLKYIRSIRNPDVASSVELTQENIDILLKEYNYHVVKVEKKGKRLSDELVDTQEERKIDEEISV